MRTKKKKIKKKIEEKRDNRIREDREEKTGELS